MGGLPEDREFDRQFGTVSSSIVRYADQSEIVTLNAAKYRSTAVIFVDRCYIASVDYFILKIIRYFNF